MNARSSVTVPNEPAEPVAAIAGAREDGAARDARDAEDRLLVGAARTGDPRAFETLVRRHQGSLRGWLRRVSGNAALADDLAQETFLKAWTALPGFRGTGSFRAWLFGIGWRAFLSQRRHADVEARHRHRVQPVDETAPEPQAPERDLARLLAHLPEPQRQALILAYAYDFTRAEIAAALDLPEGTVKSHIHRARRTLDAMLLEEPPGHGH